MTSIRITIDELVLDGASGLDDAQLIQALQQALAAQLATGNLPSAISIPQVRREVDGFTAESVAGQIARAVYGGRK